MTGSLRTQALKLPNTAAKKVAVFLPVPILTKGHLLHYSSSKAMEVVCWFLN